MDRKSRQRHESLAHLLEFALGKAPDHFGLALDPEGWIPLKQLIQALSEEPDWRGMTQNRILDLRWALPDAPFEIEEKRARLKPDHLAALESPRRETAPPPSLLYYGSRRKPYPVYRTKGIRLAGLMRGTGPEPVVDPVKNKVVARKPSPAPAPPPVYTVEAIRAAKRSSEVVK